MNDELVQMVAQKTGLSEDRARSAAEAVMSYLKQRLPASVAQQLDNPEGSGGLADKARDLSGAFKRG
jgi:hypothetical protein